MITIIIADDQKLFATSLKSVLENDDKELSVIGIAGNGKEAVDLILSILVYTFFSRMFDLCCLQ